MKKIINSLIILLSLVLTQQLYAQLPQYKYMRALSKSPAGWAEMKLPPDLFTKTNLNLSDLRIYGIQGKDTLEAPYILYNFHTRILEKAVKFNILNLSKNEEGHYVTFEIPDSASINQIELSFAQENYDWKIDLQGSQEQLKWFNILSDARVLSIKNADTEYQYNRLKFPDAKYRYFRILVKTKDKLNLTKALFSKNLLEQNALYPIQARSFVKTNNIAEKRSEYIVQLPTLSPVARIKLLEQGHTDYYRKMRVEYATDSFKTNKGMQYAYKTLWENDISSLDQLDFDLKGQLLSTLKISIFNEDNPALDIRGVEIFGARIKLLARLDKADMNYALYYGNTEAALPVYDLPAFEERIPLERSQVELGVQKTNPLYVDSSQSPLLEKSYWLWTVMGIIILLLGFFAFRMMKN